MSDNPVEMLMGIGSEQASFPSNSRYHNVGTKKLEMDSGRTVKYLERRFVPRPENLVPLHVHRLKEGDRLDRIAVEYLGDPTLFWRICDANLALRPDELLNPVHSTLLIALPEGLGK